MSRFLFILLTFLMDIVNAGEWQVDKTRINQVVFHSSTTLLDFDGITDAVDGYLYWEGEGILQGKNEIYFEVQPALFNTGNGKRDRDMREDVLHTDKYPLSFFKGKATRVEKTDGGWQVQTEGILSLHGVEKKMTIRGSLSQHNDAMLLNASFDIKLKDFNIKAPELVAFIKVAQKIGIDVKFNLKKIK